MMCSMSSRELCFMEVEKPIYRFMSYLSVCRFAAGFVVRSSQFNFDRLYSGDFKSTFSSWIHVITIYQLFPYIAPFRAGFWFGTLIRDMGHDALKFVLPKSRSVMLADLGFLVNFANSPIWISHIYLPTTEISVRSIDTVPNTSPENVIGSMTGPL